MWDKKEEGGHVKTWEGIQPFIGAGGNEGRPLALVNQEEPGLEMLECYWLRGGYQRTSCHGPESFPPTLV